MARRIIFDVTTLARSSGQADGIVRTLRELARHALIARQDVEFIFYDLDLDAPRRIQPRWVSEVVEGSAKIDMSYFPDRLSSKTRIRERMPRAIKHVFLWIERPRRQIYLKFERWRLCGGWKERLAEAFLPRLRNQKYVRELAKADGGFRRLLPHTVALDGPSTATSDDVLLLAGSDWLAMYHQLARAMNGDRPRVIVLCYDIIPLLFPQFFLAQNREAFRQCFHEVFPLAQLVIFNARRIQDDARAYCTRNNLELRKSAIVKLGANFDPVSTAPVGELPGGLERERYALFVSTIEPRKGHRLLHRVWKRLLAAGIPQAHGFKLVFLGRQGWLVEDLMAELQADPCVGDSLMMLSNVDDGMLSQLYTNAAFCVYPSLYEGFGLPVIESFRYGKAVISSDGGALPETVGPFSPIVGAQDEDAWFDIMAQWIADPVPRQEYERLIRTEFEPRSWDDAAREFFDVIDRSET